MFNYFKTIEILVCLQSIFISTFIPIYVTLPISNFKYDFEFPLTLQIPTIILLSLIFKYRVVFSALTIYIFLGLFIIPIFHEGGSLGYLLSPNFGYLLGYYPLIKTINNLNEKNKIYIYDFIQKSIKGIALMHIIGILYNFILIVSYKQFNIFLYNFGKYSLGMIGYHLLMLIPITLFIKPINYLKINR